METKREKFVRLAESRTTKAVDAIVNISSLSNIEAMNTMKMILGRF